MTARSYLILVPEFVVALVVGTLNIATIILVQVFEESKEGICKKTINTAVYLVHDYNQLHNSKARSIR